MGTLKFYFIIFSLGLSFYVAFDYAVEKLGYKKVVRTLAMWSCSAMCVPILFITLIAIFI